jgi:DNA repair photolyase
MRKIVYREYEPTSVLNVHKRIDGGWFWNKYSAFPYLGCYYGCEYCYWRDEKYNRLAKEPEAAGLNDPFSQYIKIKKNAAELLTKSLTNKPKEIIYFDSYQPIESKYHLAREMLKIFTNERFPLFINEKSPLLLKDLDVIEQINRRTYVNVGFSIVFSEDNRSKKIFESRTPSIDSRFDAMKKLSDHGINTGTVLMPVLPLICDDEENIRAIVRKTKDAGGTYVLDGGLTLRGYCGVHFYKFLKDYDESLVQKYGRIYADKKILGEHYARSHLVVKKYCEEYNLTNHIVRPISFYPEQIQFNKKVAEHFYLKSKEIMMTKGMSYRQFAFLKVAWTIDSLTNNIKELFEKRGKKGLLELKGIGKKMSEEVISVFEKVTI